MKILFIFLFSFSVITGYSQNIDSSKTYVLTEYNQLKEVLIREGDSITEFSIFMPTYKELYTADSTLNKYLLKDNLNIKNYLIQLMFVVDDTGKKYVFIVGLCYGIAENNADQWKSTFLYIDDGGRCYFLSKMDLHYKKIINQRYNGRG